MKRILTLLILVLLTVSLVGCGAAQTQTPKQEEAKPQTAEEVVNALKAKGLSIDNIIVYTAETDPNSLLGRPNQYTSKVKFADTNLEQTDTAEPTGGTIEFFTSNEGAKARKEYIDNFGKSMPMLVEYSYINNGVLLRLDKELTPDQASNYEKAFAELKI